MANKKGHLTAEERFFIGTCLKAGDSYRDIARRLPRGLSTIAEEVSENGGRARYDAGKAQHRAYLKQHWKKRDCMKVALDPFLAKFVEGKLRAHWSPERISGWLEKRERPYASPKAIRKFARSRGLESYLYRRGKPHAPKEDKSIEWLSERVFVDDPRCIRDGYGHWEGDFIVSSKSAAVLLVLVERTTKDTIIRWLPNRRNALVRRMISSALRGKAVRSLTVDNDIAFIQHPELADAIKASVYFARPYRSTDKALVENTNRWVRWFVPKRTDLKDVSKEKVAAIEEWFNTVPRQCLDFSTSREMVSLADIKNGCSY
jgi:transposase, IS30 family